MDGDNMLNRRQVELRTGLSRSTIYAGMRAGTFPVAVKVGPKAVRWPESTIDQWLDSRPLAVGNS